MSENSQKPLDARLAAWLIAPLRNTRVTPSQLTTVRLVVGLAASFCLALGPRHFMLGTWLFVVSHFLDHADGELARLSGKSSRFGHYYDLIADALVTITLFIGLGIGLRGNELGNFAPLLGVIAGIAVTLTFWLHLQTSKRLGARAPVPKTVLFETEDVLYLIPLVIWAEGAKWFLITASIGAPLFGLWLFIQYRAASASASASESGQQNA